MVEEFNFKSICDITTRVMELPTNSLSLKSKKQLYTVARSVAGYIGRTEEDIQPRVIAKVLNKNRTLVYHYLRSHKNNYANCEIYRNTFNKVYRVYKSIDGDKDIFLDSDFMKKHLLKNGVTEVEKPDVFLEINSGQVNCKINTSYFEFSNQLEIINLALKNYHYTIKII
tara:strand:+ start:512 stop:1021 length:510 start_codon:yes stop_codon:yes gene_type:complete